MAAGVPRRPEETSGSLPNQQQQPPGSGSTLTRQYVDSLFRGRSPSECQRLQALLYLGSDRWRDLHGDFRTKGQPFVKTAEVLQWVKSDRAVIELQEFGVYLVGEESSGAAGRDSSEKELDHQSASAAQVVSERKRSNR